MKVALLDDPRIDLQQRWLDGYQLEVYLLIKLLKLGYRNTEVPVGEGLPLPVGRQRQKMRHLPISGTSLASIFVVGLGIERVIRTGSAPTRIR